MHISAIINLTDRNNSVHGTCPFLLTHRHIHLYIQSYTVPGICFLILKSWRNTEPMAQTGHTFLVLKCYLTKEYNNDMKAMLVGKAFLQLECTNGLEWSLFKEKNGKLRF